MVTVYVVNVPMILIASALLFAGVSLVYRSVQLRVARKERE